MSFFGEGWGAVGKWKAIWRIVPLKKILVTPLALSIIIKKMKNYYFEEANGKTLYDKTPF